MPLMRPPSYQHIRYNNLMIKDGDDVDVLGADVDALKAAGWLRHGQDKKTPAWATHPESVTETESEGEES